MKIAVTGSLGSTSKPLVEELVKAGNDVTVISSSAERQKDIEAIGAKAAIGSLDDVAFLTSVFTGQDAVYCMVPPDFRELNQNEYYAKIGRNYAKAIEDSGVKRVIFLSSWGADIDHGTGVILGSYKVEQILNKVPGISLTHLRAGSIFTNLFGFINMIKHAGFIGANYGGDDQVVWVHPTDIAAAAAEELQTERPAGIHIRHIASEEKTASETAAILGRAIGKPDLEWKLFTDEQAKAGMMQNGIPESIANDLVELSARVHDGTFHKNFALSDADMGKVRVEDFAKEFAAAYGKS